MFILEAHDKIFPLFITEEVLIGSDFETERKHITFAYILF